jgi:NADP-dependent 3-hydroxy acid dehydrogenase YdfG
VNVLIIGSNSDIAQAITPMLVRDGHRVEGWSRDQDLPLMGWDLLIITIGQVSPVGNWWDQGDSWEKCVRSNLFVPLHLLKRVWYRRNKSGSTVIWFGGSNPQKIMKGYSAYNTSKMAVLKLVEQLDFETPDCRFIAFGPGYVKTKIHKATLEANWPNERIERGDEGNSMTSVYEALMWCVEHRDECGGRNICVSDFKGDSQYWNKDQFKLRRIE